MDVGVVYALVKFYLLNKNKRFVIDTRMTKNTTKNDKIFQI